MYFGGTEDGYDGAPIFLANQGIDYFKVSIILANQGIDI